MIIFRKKISAPFCRQRALIVAILLMAPLLTAGILNPAHAQAASPVEAMVSNFANQVLHILANRASATRQKVQFANVFLKNTDIGAIARFTLGKYARRIKDRERKQLNRLLSTYIVQLFVVKMRGTQSEGLEILGTTERKKDIDFLVRSEIKIRKVPGFSDAPIPVKWRVQKKDGGDFKLYDINIGGFWLAQEQRSTFVDIISRNNGKISALLEYLKKETAD